MNVFMITGVCGVGKSTICKTLRNEYQVEGDDYADFILDVVNSKSKDEIQLIPIEERYKIYDEALHLYHLRLEKIAQKHKYYILENHLTVINGAKIITFPPEGFEVYKFSKLVVLEAPPEAIFKRRKNDLHRSRIEENIELIEKQQLKNKEEAKKISNVLSIPLYVIRNIEIEETIKEFSPLFRDF